MQRDVTQENLIKVNVVVKEVFFMCSVATCNDVFPKMNFQGLMLLIFLWNDETMMKSCLADHLFCGYFQQAYNFSILHEDKSSAIVFTSMQCNIKTESMVKKYKQFHTGSRHDI